MDGLAQHWPQLVFAAGLAVICYLLMRRASRRISRLSPSDTAKPIHHPPSAKNGERAELDPPPELVRWQVELHETARDLKAEIDSKLLALQALVNVAREERQKLEEATERAMAVIERKEMPMPQREVQ